MERHPALQDLSRDHFDALSLAQFIDRSLTGHEMGGTPEAAAERLLEAWDDELAWHFREEEEVILPIYGRHVAIGKDRRTGRMLEDHAWFRDKVPALAAKVDAGEPFEELLGRIGQRLHDHARFEERELFGHVEEALADDELDELSERSRAYRQANRDPPKIGPRS